MSTDRWMDKKDVSYIYIYVYSIIYIIKYYSTIKKNKLLPFVTIWMGLEGIRLSEISQRKSNAMRFHLHGESKNKANEQT